MCPQIWCLYFTVPEMWDLISIVVPEIKAKWTHVAYSMQYKINDVKVMQRDSSDSEECCEKLFDDWLTTSKGVTPKVWHTLLKCIKDVKGLSGAAEKIDQELKDKYM